MALRLADVRADRDHDLEEGICLVVDADGVIVDPYRRYEAGQG